MRRRRQRRAQTWGAFLFLFIYSLIWMGGAQNLSLFFTALGHSHQRFLATDHDEIHLVLHHPGNQDGHEAPGGSVGHQHDLLDDLLSIVTVGQENHSDHEIHLSEQAPQITTTTKTTALSKVFPQAIAAAQPLLMKPTFFSSLSPASLKPRPSLVSLRATVLLI